MSHHDYKSAETRIDTIDRKHQAQYVNAARECDKHTIDLVKLFAQNLGRPARILDIGSGFGTFLYHCRMTLPDAKLTGAEYSRRLLQIVKEQPHLNGIEFVECNIVVAPPVGEYDVVVATAVLYQFHDDEFKAAIRNIASCLAPGGMFVCYEFYTNFPHSLEIRERSPQYNESNGVPLYVRNVDETTRLLTSIGFRTVDVVPFEIGIDLDRRSDIGGQNATDAYTDSLKTFTLPTGTGHRLMFRGAIYEPWCHLRALKAR